MHVFSFYLMGVLESVTIQKTLGFALHFLTFAGGHRQRSRQPKMGPFAGRPFGWSNYDRWTWVKACQNQMDLFFGWKQPPYSFVCLKGLSWVFTWVAAGAFDPDGQMVLSGRRTWSMPWTFVTPRSTRPRRWRCPTFFWFARPTCPSAISLKPHLRL